MRRRTKYILALAVFLTIVSAASALLVRFHPSDVAVHLPDKNETGTGETVKLLPSCPFYTLTGLYCPGCGSTRAVHYLLIGDWRMSLRSNPLLLPMLPFLILLLARFFYEGIAERTLPFPGLIPISTGIAVLLCLFWILRNIPLDCFDWMRPV